jgi:hypothetical protein
MKQLFLRLILITPLALMASAISSAHAQANDMFTTKAAADNRAKELKCSGAFAMSSDWAILLGALLGSQVGCNAAAGRGLGLPW